MWTPLSTAEIYYCDAIEQTSIARYLLCVDCLRDAGHRLSQRVHNSLQQEGDKYNYLSSAVLAHGNVTRLHGPLQLFYHVPPSSQRSTGTVYLNIF